MTLRSGPAGNPPSGRPTGKSRTASRLTTVLAIVSICAMGWSTLGNRPVRVVYNASDSIPSGWYRITPAGSIAVGDVVLVELPPAAAALAASRGYLPRAVPLLKPVVATAPQKVCVVGPRVSVDGMDVANVLEHDRLGRPMPRWGGCQRLTGDEILLLGVDNAESFDGRYFGPVSLGSVLGKAHPLLLD